MAKAVTLSNEEIVDAMHGRLLSREQIETVESILDDMRYCHAKEEGKEREKGTEDTCLVEYKFNKLEAIQHIEKMHGKKLKVFKTGTAYYDGEPRVIWQLEDQKKEQWDNPNPMLGGGCIDALFFPDDYVVSRKISVSAEIFEFVVREKRDRVETAKEEGK